MPMQRLAESPKILPDHVVPRAFAKHLSAAQSDQAVLAAVRRDQSPMLKHGLDDSRRTMSRLLHQYFRIVQGSNRYALNFAKPRFNS